MDDEGVVQRSRSYNLQTLLFLLLGARTEVVGELAEPTAYGREGLRSTHSGPRGRGHFYHDWVAAVWALAHGEPEAGLAVLGLFEEMLLDGGLNRSRGQSSLVSPIVHDVVQRE